MPEWSQVAVLGSSAAACPSGRPPVRLFTCLPAQYPRLLRVCAWLQDIVVSMTPLRYGMSWMLIYVCVSSW
jgi:hypothetical protein